MSAYQKFEPLLKQQRRRRYRDLSQLAIVVVVVMVSFLLVGLFDWERLVKGVPSGINLISQMLPPDFSSAINWIKPLFDTLAMSVAGTAIAVSFSLPLSLLAASNTTPHPVVFHLARLILNGLRAVPELIMGIILVAAVGFGALPGALAVGFHSIGMVGKFFAEYIEHVHPAPMEAAQAAGANKIQVIYHSILPQVFPQMIDVTLYRWEYNFRASTVMGAVGAGGIGFELIGSLRVIRYKEVLAILLVILMMVILVDSFSGYLRRRLA
ncbi:phosphonate ABC transporter, permease protein PhnE [Umezakia ovalisporum]|jgi:phosphonate transport system permease protein|uniref:Phosphonate ABC transporter, permease protein PhnE n=2 Tax=Umezakia ovalisporum TaxID=75695 RepID=A0AA43GXR2_9CYAN|nr:phosphonate ABC transporter, permease protein PhnE [Umezakia ovalisporum]MDH6055907.1 phosphonate ABC transporter, permease protein PhnE [Umezakia ovalisporum FSS-43]MDH6063709.1 phosphonate ABC transporter, permease protein PhnE [Umezakia ovalisporum FSS-62]MDH6066199.1 phosphonate ABC transporter, permease protein PhnE [Umezakia ovalisporum APH033B]MDH6072539.1 phosphonate ABC transporter, permease protein PhnE [Umezakia ovalisporum CobakiLakeA]MDH6074049.1 phosphonate ABC transporter, pe